MRRKKNNMYIKEHQKYVYINSVEGLNFKRNSMTPYEEFAIISEIIMPTMHIYL